MGRLCGFYRPRENGDVFAGVDMARVTHEVVALTQTKWKDQAQAAGRTVAVKLDLLEVRPIAGNESELQEVFTNLIFNAVGAMPGGGTITLHTRQRGDEVLIEVGARWPGHHRSCDARYVG